ncbi:MAG: tetratricopeptide repeat protein [Myxococcota bacterium]|jgi:tetratricopeptide (TPR) repeat protein|nr:tetratricopeptide repeat protein [Myxococcota bacterium]
MTAFRSTIRPLLAFILVLFLAGCGASNSLHAGFLNDSRPLDYGPEQPSPASSAVQDWLEGHYESLQLPEDPASPLALFAQAELAMQRGQYSTAAATFVSLFSTHSGHPLAAVALLRLKYAIGLVNDEMLLQPLLSYSIAALNPEARLDYALIATQLAIVQADREMRAPGSLAAWGTPSKWRWMGPLSPHQFADFDTDFEPLHKAQLDSTERVDSRTLQRREENSRLRFSPSWPSDGLYLAETFITADGQDFAISVSTASSIKVWVDDSLVLRKHIVENHGPRQLARLIKLSSGPHRIRVAYAASVGDEGFGLSLVPIQGDAPFAISETEPSDALGKVEPGHYLRLRGGLPDELAAFASHPFYLWLAALYANDRGDFARAHLALSLALSLQDKFIPLLIAEAEMLRTNNALDPSAATNLAIERFRRVLSIDPEAAYAKLFLAFLEFHQEQSVAALRKLDDVCAQTPNEYRAHYYRYQVLDRLEWTPLAKEALNRAQALRPMACDLASDALYRAMDEEYMPEPQTLRSESLHCPAIRESLIDHYWLPRGDIDEAIRELEGLSAQFPDRARFVARQAELYAERGDPERALELFERAQSIEPERSSPWIRARVDILLSLGRSDEAESLLSSAIEAEPTNLELIGLLRQFGGLRVLEELRKPGLQLVQEYLQKPRVEEHSAYYLLDYGAFRYYPDGKSLSVTHQIARVLSKDGKNRLGEVWLPPNAIVTQLRTIKADGVTTIEPELIPNKSTISMPNLEVGDFIEVEYLTADPPRKPGTSSFIMPRWYFQIFDSPLMYSEIVIEIPESMQPTIDTIGSVPAPSIETREGFRRYTYLMTDMIDPRREPSSPDLVEIAPSVQFAYDIRAEDRRKGIYNVVLWSCSPSPELEDAALLGGAGAGDPEEIARRLFSFVKTEIAESSDSYFGSSAAWTWNTRKGSRLGLLKALLDISKVKADVVIVKPWFAPTHQSLVDNFSDYTHVVLRVEDGRGGWLWLDPTTTYAKFDYLPSYLQGQPGLVIGMEQEELVVDSFDPELERQHIEYQIEIDANGDATGTGIESNDGLQGTNLRNFLAALRNDPDRLRQRIADQLVRFFGDVAVTEHEIQGLDDETAISIRYDFQAQSFATVQGAMLQLSTQLLNDNLAARFASLPSRSQQLVLAELLRQQVALGLSLPSGSEWIEIPESQRIESDFGSFEREVTDNGNVLRIQDRLELKMQRIEPEHYAAFSAFCSAVDKAQALSLRAQLELVE